MNGLLFRKGVRSEARHLRPLAIALMLALPAAAFAQSSAERDREREQARIERDRETRQRNIERAQERAERDRERAQERAERERAGSLDTPVAFATRGPVTHIHPISGDLTLSGARGNVVVETVSGDLDLRDVIAKQVRTHTTSGEVTFQGPIIEGGRYEFNTHSGGIGLDLPPDIGAELSIATFSGGIESDFPITLPRWAHGISAARAKRLTF